MGVNCTSGNGRIHGYDTVRGFSVISMVLFHLCYDLRFIVGLEDFPPLSPAFVDVWRATISWTFIFVAGCMFNHSRDNLRRSGKYLLVAALIFVVTYVAAVDTPINFGVIFCMGACTLFAWLLDLVGLRPRGLVAAALLALAFIAFLHVPDGYVLAGDASIPLPRWPYDSGLLSWAGFPGPDFESGDYYPLVPHLFLYLSGVAFSARLKSRGYARWFEDLRCRPLEFAGRHSLGIYLLHQPLLLLLCLPLMS